MSPFQEQQPTNFWAGIISPMTTLLAVFAGAWFAFLLQNKREKKKETNTNVAALNKVQINLIQQLNMLTNFNKTYVQPYKDHSITWIAIPANPHIDYSKLQIDSGSLFFLVENNSSNLISNILLVEEKFQMVINLINLRSKVHVDRLQPKLEEIGFKEGENFAKSIKEVEKLLGVRLVSELKKLTKDVISFTEDAIQSHEEIIKEIKTTGTRLFPKKRVLSFEYHNNDKEKKDQDKTEPIDKK